MGFRRIEGVAGMTCSRMLSLLALGIVCTHSSARQQGPDDCVLTIGPDIVVGDLQAIRYWGSVGSISAYSIATTSCNLGDETVPWRGTNSNHPVIAQNMYRFKDGRFHQIGMSFVKHGFSALQGGLCCTCQPNPDDNALGVGCSDPYNTTLNGDQYGFAGVAGLGPRFEINPYTGQFPFPYTSQGVGGDAIYKRLQVNNADLDPSLNPSARYFGEGHYISKAEATAGNHFNNASWRELNVTGGLGGGWNMVFTETVVTEQPAIYAWQVCDPTVHLATVDLPSEGRLVLGSSATELGDGQWLYLYAMYNMNSHIAASSLAIPLPEGTVATDLEFRDVGYHSGEPFDGTDWSVDQDGSELTWSTVDFATNPNANAILWGTMYSFGFVTNAPPTIGQATIGLFRTGGSIAAAAHVPLPPDCVGDGNGDDQVDFADLNLVIGNFGTAGPSGDLNGDGAVDIVDLNQVLGNFGSSCGS